MGVVRFRTPTADSRCGYLAGSSVLDLGDQHAHEALAALPDTLGSGRQVYDRREVTMLPPVDPGTVVRLDGCYAHDTTDPHLGDLASRETPSLWVAPADSLAADGTEVQLPAMTDDVRPGVELGLVVGEHARNLTPDEALESIAGYTVCRTLRADGEHPGLYGYRMFAGFLGVGPTVVPEITPPVALGVRRDGETVDQSSTARLRFSLGKLVGYASRVFTLDPGDLVVTGDPIRTEDAVDPGETVTAWVESVGQQTTVLTAEGEQ